ncbi:hypothetical protein BCD48_26450 [Pseudofrankia sp. BMG5.36]|nr:hypothetical protein BCD48_26450 [Pseudofrankia sp. BMG5.36]
MPPWGERETTAAARSRPAPPTQATAGNRRQQPTSAQGANGADTRHAGGANGASATACAPIRAAPATLDGAIAPSSVARRSHQMAKMRAARQPD